MEICALDKLSATLLLFFLTSQYLHCGLLHPGDHIKRIFKWFKRHLSVVAKQSDKWTGCGRDIKALFFSSFPFSDTGSNEERWWNVLLQRAGDPQRQTTFALRYLQAPEEARGSGRRAAACVVSDHNCVHIEAWYADILTDWFKGIKVNHKLPSDTWDDVMLSRSGCLRGGLG